MILGGLTSSQKVYQINPFLHRFTDPSPILYTDSNTCHLDTQNTSKWTSDYGRMAANRDTCEAQERFPEPLKFLPVAFILAMIIGPLDVFAR